MRDEDSVDIAKGDFKLGQALGRAAAGVEQQPVRSGLHQDGRSETVDARHRVARTEQRDIECLVLRDTGHRHRRDPCGKYT